MGWWWTTCESIILDRVTGCNNPPFFIIIKRDYYFHCKLFTTYLITYIDQVDS